MNACKSIPHPTNNCMDMQSQAEEQRRTLHTVEALESPRCALGSHMWLAGPRMGMNTERCQRPVPNTVHHPDQLPVLPLSGAWRNHKTVACHHVQALLMALQPLYTQGLAEGWHRQCDLCCTPHLMMTCTRTPQLKFKETSIMAAVSGLSEHVAAAASARSANEGC